jgi:hypothetical protein
MSKELRRSIRHIDYHLKFQTLLARRNLILEKHLDMISQQYGKADIPLSDVHFFNQLGMLPMRPGLFCGLRDSTLALRGICEYW